MDAQFGTPYPRSAGFDTDNGISSMKNHGSRIQVRAGIAAHIPNSHEEPAAWVRGLAGHTAPP